MLQLMLTSGSECVFAPSGEHSKRGANGKMFPFKLELVHTTIRRDFLERYRGSYFDAM